MWSSWSARSGGRVDEVVVDVSSAGRGRGTRGRHRHGRRRGRAEVVVDDVVDTVVVVVGTVKVDVVDEP
jgi:hypothetical protein